jgi:hypothetical protein
MPDITNIEHQRKVKELKDKYQREIDGINIKLEQLTEQLEQLQSIIDTPPKTEEELDWHLKPPLSTDEISDLYSKYMKHSYNPDDYTDKDTE